MRNFGLLKTIVENSLVKKYKTYEFKKIVREFKEFVDNNKEVGKVYLNYGSIMKMKNLSENVAKDFLSVSTEDIKNTIKENKKQFIEFDAWVETLDETKENNYTLLDDLIFAKTAEDFLKLIESKNRLEKLLTEKKEEVKTINETIDIPLDKMFDVVANTFSNEYSTLSESQLFELKSILKLTPQELNEGIERLRNEIVKKLDDIEESDDETKIKINETKQRVLNSPIDSLSYFKLKKLSEGL